jgi:CRISPR-associated protein Cmr3
MTLWMIEPCEPLIIRDGRPFDRQPGVLAVSLPFPFPSTTAGAARSRAGTDDQGSFSVEGTEALNSLREISIRGPLLFEVDQERAFKQSLLVPAPGDALLLESKEHSGQVDCRRLIPLTAFPGSLTDAPKNTSTGRELLPVGPVPATSAKPAKQQPAFWRWCHFERWLRDPEHMDKQVFAKGVPGISALPVEQRVHVALERGMMVALEGALFETRGLEFTSASDAPTDRGRTRRLALLLDVTEPGQYHIRPGLDCLGAERRLANWQEGDVTLPACPDSLRQQIVREGYCRLILLTPACFKQGYLPDFLQQESKGIQAEVQAAVVQRPQVISGWDMEYRRPRPTRRLVPAGSVYFLRLHGELAAIEQWIERTWMHSISDDTQDRRDGFGLAVLGSWSGERVDMEIAKEEA